MNKMKNKIIITIMIVMFLVSFTSAAQDSLGTFKQNQDIELLQICGTCTYNNITSIVLPNGTHLQIDAAMTKRGMEYTYTFSQTDLRGTYSVSGFGDLDGTDNAWAYDFLVTTTGDVFTQEKSIFYVGAMIVLCFLFIMSVLGVAALPKNSFTMDDQGEILSINMLRHLRIVLIGIAWGLLTMISYLAMNVSKAYLATDLLAGIFQVIFTIMMTAAIIGLPVTLAYILWRVIKDIAINKMIDRGIFNGKI